MYKLIVDNIVVDVVKKLRYVRYIPELNKIVVTSAASAHAVCGSDNKTFYAIPEVTLPHKKSHWKTATIIEIGNAEYLELKKALKQGGKVTSNSLLNIERAKKISQMSDCCNSAIISGVCCVLSDGKEHHFKLTVEDQLNMIDLQRELDSGAEQIVFHATDETCKAYSREDIQKILQAAALHKKQQTTYFNLLKGYIKEVTDLEILKSITYGEKIRNSSTLDSAIQELL